MLPKGSTECKGERNVDEEMRKGDRERSSLEKFSTAKVEQDHEVPRPACVLLRQMSKTCQESGREHE